MEKNNLSKTMLKNGLKTTSAQVGPNNIRLKLNKESQLNLFLPCRVNEEREIVSKMAHVHVHFLKEYLHKGQVHTKRNCFKFPPDATS